MFLATLLNGDLQLISISQRSSNNHSIFEIFTPTIDYYARAAAAAVNINIRGESENYSKSVAMR